MGEREETLMNSFKEVAALAVKDILIYLTGPIFSEEEKEDIFNHLPENCHF